MQASVLVKAILCGAAAGLASTLAAGEQEAFAQDEQTLTIGAAMSMSRERAPDVRSARGAAQAADGEVDVAIAGYLPTATAHVSASNQWQRANVLVRGTGAQVGVTGESAQAEVGGGIAWTPWDSWKTPSTVASARATSRAAQARIAVATLSTAAAAALRYLDVLFDDARVEVARTTVKIRERHAALARGLVVAGIRPAVEEARARVELEAARADVIALESQGAQDRVRLATLLQLDPTVALRLVRPAVLPTVSDDARAAATEALRVRPEVRAAQEDVAASEASVTAAGAARWPQLTVRAGAADEMTRTDADPRFLQGRNASAGVTVSVPLFDWAIWSRPAVERGGLAIAQAHAAAASSRVRGEAAEAAYRTRAARALLDQTKKAAEVAAATLAVVESRYQSGLASPLELLESGTSDAEARRKLVDAELELATATVQTLAATGRLSELER
jgi:outer membrane protein TolC